MAEAAVVAATMVAAEAHPTAAVEAADTLPPAEATAATVNRT
jgi:hypothetical protein